jgi:hypothetical protein
MYQYEEMEPLRLVSKCCCNKKFHAVVHGAAPSTAYVGRLSTDVQIKIQNKIFPLNDTYMCTCVIC